MKKRILACLLGLCLILCACTPANNSGVPNRENPETSSTDMCAITGGTLLSVFEDWLNTIDSSKIVQIKTRYAPDGVALGTLADILVTTNDETIDQFLTACQSIYLIPVSGTDAIAPPGSAETTITFSLKNRQEYTLSFTGQLYYNGDLTYCLSGLPSLKNGQEVVLRHSFISYGENAILYRNGALIDQTFGVDELEFVLCDAPDGEPTYSGLFYAIETSFGRLCFVTPSMFYRTTEDTPRWYELCGCTINSFLYDTTVPTG